MPSWVTYKGAARDREREVSTGVVPARCQEGNSAVLLCRPGSREHANFILSSSIAVFFLVYETAYLESLPVAIWPVMSSIPVLEMTDYSPPSDEASYYCSPNVKDAVFSVISYHRGGEREKGKAPRETRGRSAYLLKPNEVGW
jgi:hypothetical protein